MPASLLDTQFVTLEEPAGEPLTVAVDIEPPTQEVVRATLVALAKLDAPAGR